MPMQEKWIDIFKGGQQTDSGGQTHNGDKLIDQALKTFDGSHTPPVVIGHPKDNAPAYGWVKDLREVPRMGKRILQAKFDQVNPAFAQALKDGAYKKRSAAFYPDGSLRHVGFLGAMPPAIKGLEDIKFNEQGNTFEFNESEGKMKFKEFLEAFKFWKSFEDSADTVFPGIPTQKPEGRTFSEADIEALKKEAAEKAAKAEKERLQAEFAEKEATRQRAERARTIKTFLQDKTDAGELPPAWIKQGLPEFMEQLDDAGAEIEFSEGNKKTAYSWFKAFLDDNFKKGSLFSEMATKSNASQASPDAEMELAKDIAARA